MHAIRFMTIVQKHLRIFASKGVIVFLPRLPERQNTFPSMITRQKTNKTTLPPLFPLFSLKSFYLNKSALKNVMWLFGRRMIILVWGLTPMYKKPPFRRFVTMALGRVARAILLGIAPSMPNLSMN